MTEPVTGGCKCGAVRYNGIRINASMFRCHCRDCQQLTGSGHSEMVPLEHASFSVNGDLTVYTMQGGSGRSTYSGFCPICGSQITRRSDRMGDRIYVHAASLNNPGLYAPEKSIHAESAQIWDQMSIIKAP